MPGDDCGAVGAKSGAPKSGARSRNGDVAPLNPPVPKPILPIAFCLMSSMMASFCV